MEYNRRKFIGLSLLLPMLLISKEEINYCEYDILNNNVVTEVDETRSFVILDESYKELSSYLNKLVFMPYNSELMKKSLDLIIADYDLNKKNPKYKNLLYNKDVFNIVLTSFIFVDISYLKKYEIKLFELFNEPGVIKNVSDHSYFNYLVLYKVGFFKYKEQEEEFLANIKYSKNDFAYYYIAANVFKFNKDIIYELDPKIEKYLRKNKDTYLKKCYNSKALGDLKKSATFYTLLELIVLMDIYPDDKDALTYLYYNINNGSSLLNYLTIYTELLKSNYYESFDLIKTVYEYEGQPEYVKNDLIKIAILASNKSLLLNDYYKTRHICISALYAFSSMERKNKTSEVIANSIVLKNNLKVSSEKIINTSLSDNNLSNSNFLIKETRDLLKIR